MEIFIRKESLFYPCDGVSSATGTIAGHGYVDLGLSVKWATCNVGASSPEDYGNYYAWGETSTKSSYEEGNSETYKKGKYNYDIAGNSYLDAARANWGSTWRLPTASEIVELIDNCTWTWTTMNGKSGYKVTSNVNDKSIFLPASGFRSDSLLYDVGSVGDSSLFDAGSVGDIWSSTPDSSHTDGAYDLYFGIDYYKLDLYRGFAYRDFSDRCDGLCIRPVSE